MLKEFREFAARGNVIDMAVGIIIGAAFGVIVKSFVSDIIMPPIGLLLGKVSFSNLMIVLRQGIPSGPYSTPDAAQAAKAVTINYGAFIDNILSFIIVVFAVFILVKQMNRFRKQADPTTKECPYCLSAIPLKAARCAHCTSALTASEEV